MTSYRELQKNELHSKFLRQEKRQGICNKSRRTRLYDKRSETVIKDQAQALQELRESGSRVLILLLEMY
jgi:hypothetical protein